MSKQLRSYTFIMLEYAASITMAVLLMMFLPSSSHAQTKLQYLDVNAGLPGPSAGITKVFNLPGYGTGINNVLVTLSSLASVPPMKYEPRGNFGVQNQSAGFFAWGDTQSFQVFNNSNPGKTATYTATFQFIGPKPPDPRALVLVVAGLRAGTTATVSRPGYLAGEFTFKATGGLPTLSTALDSGGTILSAGPCKPPLPLLPPCDSANTGWALFQTTDPLPPGNILKVSFTQVVDDGIQFTLGYAANPPDPCCPPWNSDSLESQLQVSQAGNVTSPMTFTFLNSQPAGGPGFDQMQKYIDYLHSRNSLIKNIILNWRIQDCGPSGPGTSPICSTPPLPETFTEWSCSPVGTAPGCSSSNPSSNTLGGGGVMTNYAPPMTTVDIAQGRPVNRWYRIHTGIYLNDGFQFWPDECDNVEEDFTLYVGKALAKAASTNTDQIAVEVRKPGEKTGRMIMLPFAHAQQ